LSYLYFLKDVIILKEGVKNRGGVGKKVKIFGYVVKNMEVLD